MIASEARAVELADRNAALREEVKSLRRVLLAAEESRGFLDVLIETTPSLVVLTDRAGRILLFNRACEALTGYNREHVVGRTISELFLAPAWRKQEAHRVANLESPEVREPREVPWVTRSGRERWIEWRSTPLRLSGRNEATVLSMGNDVTLRRQTETALRASEAQLRLMIDSVTDYAIFQLDHKGLVTSWNSGAERLKGYAAKEIIGRHFSCLYPAKEKTARVPERVLRSALRQGRYEGEGWRVNKDGSRFWASVTISPLRNGEAKQGGFVKVTRDITNRMLMEQALRETKEKLQTIFDAAPLAILGLDRQGRITSWNSGARRLFGWAEREVLGRVSPTVPSGGLRDFRSMIERIWRHGPSLGMIFPRQKKNGDLIQASISGAPLTNAAGRTVGVMIMLEDVTKRLEAEHDLRSLAGRLFQMQDQERSRLGHELHDTTAQGLAALEINLSALYRIGSDLPSGHRALLRDSLTLAAQCAREIRTLSYTLRPPLLEEMGLRAALRTQVTGFARRSGIRCQLVLPRSLVRLPADVELAFFRFVQEALANVHRHSASPSARISLKTTRRCVILEVSDRGHGLPAKVLNAFATGRGSVGVGLTGMRERMRRLGGDFEILSTPRGTLVRASLSVDRPEP